MEGDGKPPLATPNIMPSESIQETLHEILEKLGKLDIIENSVNNLQATLMNLGKRTKTFKGFHIKAKKDINDLQGSVSFTEGKYKTIRSQKSRKETECLVQNLYLEAYSRRENVKFENINEFEKGDKENTEQVLRLFMKTELGFMEVSSVQIQRVQRLGKKIPKVQGLREDHVAGKTSKRQQLQNVPGSTTRNRPEEKTANGYSYESQGKENSRSIQPDKLVVRGKPWPE